MMAGEFFRLSEGAIIGCQKAAGFARLEDVFAVHLGTFSDLGSSVAPERGEFGRDEAAPERHDLPHGGKQLARDGGAAGSGQVGGGGGGARALNLSLRVEEWGGKAGIVRYEGVFGAGPARRTGGRDAVAQVFAGDSGKVAMPATAGRAQQGFVPCRRQPSMKGLHGPRRLRERVGGRHRPSLHACHGWRDRCRRSRRDGRPPDVTDGRFRRWWRQGIGAAAGPIRYSLVVGSCSARPCSTSSEMRRKQVALFVPERRASSDRPIWGCVRGKWSSRERALEVVPMRCAAF